MSEVYDAILAFSLKQSPWKQDALRRVVAHGELDAAELDAAVQMCRSAHGLTVTASMDPTPLSPAHLPAGAGPSAAPVTLAALSDFEHVNALLPGQTLPFAPQGLTTVFGYNGAGKSGYARVLKKLCRARGAVEPILTDVFAPAGGAPRATVSYRVGDADLVWTGEIGEQAGPGPEALSQIGVYDRSTGVSACSTKQRVEFLPPGLDLLPRLLDVLVHVGQVLKKEDAGDTQPAGYPVLDTTTAAGSFLAGLNADTTTAELDHSARWSEQDEAALMAAIAELAKLRAEDPAKRAAMLEGRAQRIERLSQSLVQARHNLRDDIATRVAEVRAAQEAALEAQRLHASGSLAEDSLPGTGGGPWKLLWQAARAYSQDAAYPGAAFPNVAQGAQCVLCQQDLDDVSRDRLQTFDAFVRDALAQQVAEANKELAAALKHLNDAIPIGLLDGSMRSDEASIDTALPGLVDAFLDTARRRRDALLTALGQGGTEAALPQLGAAPVSNMNALVATLREQISALRATSTAEALRTQAQIQARLGARKTLHTQRAMLDAEVARLDRGRKRAVARKDCNTTGLSALAGKLTQKHVTGTLVDAFNRELKALGGVRLRVELQKASARKGESYTHLVLRDAVQHKAGVDGVFSEGERRLVALAAFMADLSISPERSAIVFDDPVTSMDHRWRKWVAERIAAEAVQRQVVVFTHDAVFLTMLEAECRAATAAHAGVHVQNLGQTPGHCSVDLPWETKKLKARIVVLGAAYESLRKTRDALTEEEYALKVVAFLGRLRNTWERAIEEYLFNGSVQRFGYGVQTLSLKTVDVVDGDYTAIETGMGACSAWVHDPAQALANPPPTPEQLAEMVNDLVAWLAVIRKRRPKASLTTVKPIVVKHR
jgi:hypothetical protein